MSNVTNYKPARFYFAKRDTKSNGMSIIITEFRELITSSKNSGSFLT